MASSSWIDLKDSSTLVLGFIERLGELLETNNYQEAKKVYSILLNLLESCQKVCQSILKTALIPNIARIDLLSDEHDIGLCMAGFIFGITNATMVMSGNKKPHDDFYKWRNNLDAMVMLSEKLAKKLIESN